MIAAERSVLTFKEPNEYKPGDVLIPANVIETRLDEMSREISNRYMKGQELLVVGLLTGAAWVTIDLFQRLHDGGLTDAEMDFMKVSSYPMGTHAQHEPRIIYDSAVNPADRDVLVVDDIADTGKSLKIVTTLFESKDARSVASAVLLDKPSRREVVFQPDFVGFTIPNVWVQGRGLDTNNKHRGKRFIEVGGN